MGFLKLRRIALLGALCLSVAALFSIPVLASGDPPTGINIGFDFNWNNGPAGYTASFIASVNGSGANLNNCGGAVNASTSSCDFPITYSIGGVPQTSVLPGGVYGNFGTSPLRCDQSPSNSAPLTLWDCFNNDSFGQIFKASATGALSGVTMPMTCLNPAGTPPTGLIALIYQVNPNGISIGATPLAQVNVNLTTCPTAASWSGKTFSSADFATIPLNFTGVNVTSGNFYAVYFGGPLVPGSQLPGIQPSPTPAPRSLILVSIALLAIGWWYRSQLLKTSQE